MGVRGLTTYIAKYADRYLNQLELHDCSLVIDGDSLSCKSISSFIFIKRFSSNCCWSKNYFIF